VHYLCNTTYVSTATNLLPHVISSRLDDMTIMDITWLIKSGGGGGETKKENYSEERKYCGKHVSLPCMPQVMPKTTTFNIQSELLHGTVKNLTCAEKKNLNIGRQLCVLSKKCRLPNCPLVCSHTV
jgi:hypothetical protein